MTKRRRSTAAAHQMRAVSCRRLAVAAAIRCASDTMSDRAAACARRSQRVFSFRRCCRLRRRHRRRRLARCGKFVWTLARGVAATTRPCVGASPPSPPPSPSLLTIIAASIDEARHDVDAVGLSPPSSPPPPSPQLAARRSILASAVF